MKAWASSNASARHGVGVGRRQCCFISVHSHSRPIVAGGDVTLFCRLEGNVDVSKPDQRRWWRLLTTGLLHTRRRAEGLQLSTYRLGGGRWKTQAVPGLPQRGAIPSAPYTLFHRFAHISSTICDGMTLVTPLPSTAAFPRRFIDSTHTTTCRAMGDETPTGHCTC